MVQTVIVTFDGQVLRPETPLDLDQSTSYIVTITPVDDNLQGDAWDVLDALQGTVDAPSDWAREHDRYLYGATLKQDEHTP